MTNDVREISRKKIADGEAILVSHAGESETDELIYRIRFLEEGGGMSTALPQVISKCTKENVLRIFDELNEQTTFKSIIDRAMEE